MLASAVGQILCLDNMTEHFLSLTENSEDSVGCGKVSVEFESQPSKGQCSTLDFKHGFELYTMMRRRVGLVTPSSWSWFVVLWSHTFCFFFPLPHPRRFPQTRRQGLMTSAPLDKQVNKPVHGEAAESCDPPAILPVWCGFGGSAFFFPRQTQKMRNQIVLWVSTSSTQMSYGPWNGSVGNCSADPRSALQTHWRHKQLCLSGGRKSRQP